MFLVHRGIHKTQLLTDTGHEVWCLIDGRIGECLLQIIEGRFIIINLTITGSQGTVGTGYLIDVAIKGEEMKGIFCEPSCQHVVVNTFGINELHGWQIVGQQLVAVIGIHEVFREGLESIGSEIGIISLTGMDEASQQHVELLLIDILLGTCSDDASRTYIIEIVQPLGRVVPEVVGINILNSINRLSLQAYIIIIGGSDNGHLRFCITQTS